LPRSVNSLNFRLPAGKAKANLRLIQLEEDTMILVKQLLAQKGNEIFSIAPDSELGSAIQDMANHDVGVLVVLNEGKIAGIFSERDFTRAFAANRQLDLGTPISTLMTEEVISVEPDSSIEECMVLMTRHHIRHLPVVQNGKLVGLISIGDLVKEILGERDRTILGLENYILGTDYNR
jgi:CBS domain-containing protein